MIRNIEREMRIVRFWSNTHLTGKDVALIFNVSQPHVSQILKRHRAERVTASRLVSNENPCGLTLKTWPVCYGDGCYHAGLGTCPAFKAAKQKHPGMNLKIAGHAHGTHNGRINNGKGIVCRKRGNRKSW